MKSKFYIFGLISVCLLAISILGCSQDEMEETDTKIVTPPTPMEQLTGKYTLISFEANIDGVSLILEPPAAFGEFTLGSGGGSWSLTLVISKADFDENLSGNSWSANATTLMLYPYNDPPDPYKWEGKYLILIYVAEDSTQITSKWQKL